MLLILSGKKKYAPQNDARWLSDSHDHLHCYGKHKELWKPNGLPRSESTSSSYKNPDNDPRGPWISDNLSVRTYSAATDYPITTPAGLVMNPPRGRCWGVSKEKYAELLADNRIWLGVNGTAGPRRKRFLSEVSDGIVPTTVWLRDRKCVSCYRRFSSGNMSRKGPASKRAIGQILLAKLHHHSVEAVKSCGLP